MLYFILYKFSGGIAQLARAPALQAGGHRFESDYLHQIKFPVQQKASDNQSRKNTIVEVQLSWLEHRSDKAGVDGSSPFTSTTLDPTEPQSSAGFFIIINFLSTKYFPIYSFYLFSFVCANDISIKEICYEAGINRSSFYVHYQDINDLMIKVEHYYLE